MLNEVTVCWVLDADIGLTLNLETTDHIECVYYRGVIHILQLSLKKHRSADKDLGHGGG